MKSHVHTGNGAALRGQVEDFSQSDQHQIKTQNLPNSLPPLRLPLQHTPGVTNAPDFSQHEPACQVLSFSQVASVCPYPPGWVAPVLLAELSVM